jgi:hypothetical protein
MPTVAEPFTNCHYCELRAESKHRSLVPDRRSGRRRAHYIYACFLHKELADRDARLGLAP